MNVTGKSSDSNGLLLKGQNNQEPLVRGRGGSSLYRQTFGTHGMKVPLIKPKPQQIFTLAVMISMRDFISSLHF